MSAINTITRRAVTPGTLTADAAAKLRAAIAVLIDIDRRAEEGSALQHEAHDLAGCLDAFVAEYGAK